MPRPNLTTLFERKQRMRPRGSAPASHRSPGSEVSPGRGVKPVAHRVSGGKKQIPRRSGRAPQGAARGNRRALAPWERGRPARNLEDKHRRASPPGSHARAPSRQLSRSRRSSERLDESGDGRRMCPPGNLAPLTQPALARSFLLTSYRSRAILPVGFLEERS
jgi:hypothetical protein